MMNDRELLELAARAAGIEHFGFGLMLNDAPYLKTRTSMGMFAPLTDDGDALRLAVKLGIEFHVEGGDSDEAVWANDVMIWTDGDRFSATRRAIVRAAAQIGKSM